MKFMKFTFFDSFIPVIILKTFKFTFSVLFEMYILLFFIHSKLTAQLKLAL